ncbi:uncharacterized protein [Clytia hemisphaerica]|uniref:Protein kinase domain-containing protein n=1 Tax=Clytia hemisphaerica TaxID=252671 RepID=A0A7M5WVD6_9CNID
MGCPNSKDCKIKSQDGKVVDIEFCDFPKSTLIVNKRVLEAYYVKLHIGAGSFSDVFKAEDKKTKMPYAIKRIQIKNENVRDMFVFEAKALRNVSHPNIIKLHDIISTPVCAFIIMDLATGGDLFERIRDNFSNGRRLTVTEARRVTQMITDALAYLHETAGITHRDLKAENVLYHSPGPSRVVISDFGFASLRGRDSVLHTFCGTPEYLSPELICKQQYTNKVDVWALGCLVYFMLSGHLPWTGLELRDKIATEPHSFSEQYWNEVPEEAKSFIDSCLAKTEENRASSSQLLQHQWIKTHKLTAADKINRQRRISLASSRPQSIGIRSLKSGRSSKSGFLPQLSKSPEEPMIAEKRFKVESSSPPPPRISPPQFTPRAPPPSHNNPRSPPPVQNMPQTSHQIKTNNFRSPLQPNSNFVPMINDIGISESIPSSSSMSYSNDTLIVLPTHCNNMINKADLYLTSDDESQCNPREHSKLPAPQDHSMLNMNGIVNGGVDLPDQECMEISTHNNLKHQNASMNFLKSSKHVNSALPPIMNGHRNALFTPRTFEQYVERAVSESSNSSKKTHLDELFTAPILRKNTGFMRRSRSSSPSNPICPILPNGFLSKSEGRVQNWLSSISQESRRQKCPRELDPDHPRFCKLCMEGKSLAKSF